MSELELMNELMDDVLTEEEKGFVVDSDQKAEWCLDRIREAEAEKEKWAEFYRQQNEKVARACDSKIEWMKHLLRPYFDRVPKKETKTQASYQLPSGKLVLKAQAPEYERDDAQLIPWLRENYEGDFVKLKESVDWASLKKAFTEDECIDVLNGKFITVDGEFVPGVAITYRDPVFKVEVK